MIKLTPKMITDCKTKYIYWVKDKKLKEVCPTEMVRIYTDLVL